MKYIYSLLLLFPMFAQAEFLEIKDAWVRAAPPNARVMVAYATVKNISTDSIWITGATSDHYKDVQIHETIEKDGLASMIHLNFIKLEAGKSVNFEPGGKHLMLFNANKPSTAGDQIDFNFHLGNGTQEAFTAIVSRNQP